MKHWLAAAIVGIAVLTWPAPEVDLHDPIDDVAEHRQIVIKGSSFPVGDAVALTEGAPLAAREAVSDVLAGTATARSVTAVRGVKVITCTGQYDYPHPGASSQKRKVNAHLTVTCTGTVPTDARMTVIKLESRMTDSTGRMGAVSFGSGRGRASTGGDLACTSKPLGYTAIGKTRVMYPPGYVPGVTTSGARSQTKRLARNPETGLCVWR